MLYPLELHNEHVDKSTGDTITAQDIGHSENESVKSVRPSTRQVAINARHKINKLLENSALTLLFSVM